MSEFVIAFILALCMAIVFGLLIAAIIIQYSKHGSVSFHVEMQDYEREEKDGTEL